MKNRQYITIITGIAAVWFQIGIAAVVDVTEGPHWVQTYESSVTIRWDTRWVAANAVEARLSVTGMSVRLYETLDPDDEVYVWNVQMGDAEEDLCDVKLSFVDAQGSSLGVLEAQLAVSKNAFRTTNVKAKDDATWQKVQTDVLIPWNAAWLDSPDSCERMTLQWSNAQTGSEASFSSFGFYPFTCSGRPKGEYDLTLSFFDGDDAVVGEPFLATIFLLARGTLLILQ